MMFMRSEKKKKHRGFAVAIGMLAMLGAYSLVTSVKEMCVCKVSSMMKGFKKLGKKKASCMQTESECVCTDESDCGCASDD